MKKYTMEPVEISGKIMNRITAARDIGTSARKGDVGGLIESESNLSHEGECWVYEGAEVSGNAQVFDDALVMGEAKVYGNAQVYDVSMVIHNAQVYGDACIRANALVLDNAQVSGSAEIRDFNVVDSDRHVKE